jgi:hypothetical protein
VYTGTLKTALETGEYIWVRVITKGNGTTTVNSEPSTAVAIEGTVAGAKTELDVAVVSGVTVSVAKSVVITLTSVDAAADAYDVQYIIKENSTAPISSEWSGDLSGSTVPGVFAAANGEDAATITADLFGVGGLTNGKYLFVRVVSKDTNGDPSNLGSSTSAEPASGVKYLDAVGVWGESVVGSSNAAGELEVVFEAAVGATQYVVEVSTDASAFDVPLSITSNALPLASDTLKIVTSEELTSNGGYTFEGLSGGDYYVRVTALSGTAGGDLGLLAGYSAVKTEKVTVEGA